MSKNIFLLSLIIFLFSLFNLSFSQQKPASQQEPVFSIPPSEGHRILAEGKARALAKVREAYRPKTLASQWDFDAIYYGLDLKIDVSTEIIYGAVTMQAKSKVTSLNTVALDLYDNMIADSIKMGTTNLSYTHSTDLINITLNRTYALDENFLLTVYYHGHPVEGGFQAFDFSYHGSPSMPIISSLSEPYFARTWWPCKDHPSDKADSADINVTIPSNLIVASNGVLRAVIDNGNGTKTYKWHESYPITTYLISVAISNYQIFSDYYHYSPADSMEVRYFVYPENYPQAVANYGVTVGAIGFFAETFGEYPFVAEKYGMAQFPWSGAMEHQTCTSILSSWYDSYVIVHELSHQWWGDYITCGSWHHIWLNEGFATYCEALYYEHLYGTSYYHSYMNNYDYAGGGTIYVQDTTDVYEIFSGLVYDKGGWVLHMLRHVVGDSTFFDILRSYYADPRFANKSALTEDFQEVCESVSGMDLDWFFQEWIYGTYRPNYRVSWMYENLGGTYRAYLHIDQIQTTPPLIFTMPIDVTIYSQQGENTFVVFNNQRSQDFQFDVQYQPTSLVVDKDKWVLRYLSNVSYGFNIVSTILSNGFKPYIYFDTLIAKGGTLPYHWEISSGALPNSLSLDSLTGIISGIALDTGNFTFTVLVKDSSTPQKSDIQDLTLRVASGTPFLRGDANGDSKVSVSDVVDIINYLLKGGPAPSPLDKANTNCDGTISIADVVYLINDLFKGGPPPC
ncbi:MAG: dockerin type I domain-containing protein [candidate division Zixibacteria bacterium]|nr:dockerin type I domain-containing protein [candidate division Zixibacteria bacterium]